MNVASYPSPMRPQVSLPCVSILGHPPASATPSLIAPVPEAATGSVSKARAASVIVAGLDDAGKPHASYFAAEQSAAAASAAALMNMMVLDVAAHDLANIAATLPPGKIFESGKAFVPFVKRSTYEKLAVHFSDDYLAAAAARVDSVAAASYADQSKGEAAARLPEDWSKLAVGDRVLASDGPGDGWYEADVRELLPDGKLRLQWRDWPEIDQFSRDVTDIALLHPKHAAA